MSVQIPGRPGKWVSSGKSTVAEAVKWALDQANGVRSDLTIAELSADFYRPGSEFNDLQAARGSVVSEKWQRDSRTILETHVWPKWGHYTLQAVRPRDVFAWLSSLKTAAGKPMSTSSKAKVFGVFKQIFDYAVFQGVLDTSPLAVVPRIIRKTKPRDVFTPEELRAIFPADPAQLAEYWGGQIWGTAFLVLADTGLRPGEVAALRWGDWFRSLGGLVVSRAVDDKGNVKGLKTEGKGVQIKPALLSSRSVGALLALESSTADTGPEALIFPNSDGNPRRTDVASHQFIARIAELARRGVIAPGGRNLTLYCLRHTFNTSALTALGDGQTVKTLMGHTTEAMQAHYDHPDAEAVLKRLQGQRPPLESIWG